VSAFGLGNLVAFSCHGLEKRVPVFFAGLCVNCGVDLFCRVNGREIAMGLARTHSGRAFSLLSGATRFGAMPDSPSLTPFMMQCFYTVVTVWIHIYLLRPVTGDLEVLAQPNTFGEGHWALFHLYLFHRLAESSCSSCVVECCEKRHRAGRRKVDAYVGCDASRPNYFVMTLD